MIDRTALAYELVWLYPAQHNKKRVTFPKMVYGESWSSAKSFDELWRWIILKGTSDNSTEVPFRGKEVLRKARWCWSLFPPTVCTSAPDIPVGERLSVCISSLGKKKGAGVFGIWLWMICISGISKTDTRRLIMMTDEGNCKIEQNALDWTLFYCSAPSVCSGCALSAFCFFWASWAFFCSAIISSLSFSRSFTFASTSFSSWSLYHKAIMN